MIKTYIIHTPKSKRTVECTKEDLHTTAKKYYNITSKDNHSFNNALFNAYTDKIIDIIYSKQKLNTYNIKVNWLTKKITTNWDNKADTIRIYNF